MPARKFLAGGCIALLLAALPLSEASAWRKYGAGRVVRSTGPVRLGPWVNGPWDYDPSYYNWSAAAWALNQGLGPYPPSDEWYPWGYAAPYERVGRKCVANEINVSPGGDYARYQRVRSTLYCPN